MRAAPGGIFALDLSRNCGWAYGRLGLPPLNGTWVLPFVGGEGARYASFENELAAALEVYQPSHLVVEAPLPLPALNNADVAKQQMGLRAFAYSEAYRASIPVHEVDAYTVRKEVLGTGRFAKGQVKAAVVAWCRRQGFDVPDDNAGDACVLWTYFSKRLACTA
jgi:Holliday junction resolvasome RuvABC endonuclease subunit